MAPGSTILPWASMVRSARGSSCSGPSATIFPPPMAMASVSSTPVGVTTRPPRTIVSTFIPSILRSISALDSPGGTGLISQCGWHGLREQVVVLGTAAAEEVPALARGQHLVEVKPRDDQLVSGRARPGDHLPHGVDDAAARDELHAVLQARLGDADDEDVVLVRAGPHREL